MRMIIARVLLVVASAWAAHAAAAQQSITDATASASPVDSAPVREMDTIVVSGVQPGPGLWRVRNGDHLLYILGTQSPLPRDMTWRSDEVRQVLQIADRVLDSPDVRIDADVGIFRGLWLLPSALKAAKNPDGQRLQEVLPAGTYARWTRLKQQYIGKDAGIEKKRPLIAVYQLYQKALSRAGMQERNVVSPVIDEVLKQRRLKSTSTALELKIEDPRQAIADFGAEQLKPQDIECFDRTLDRIEFELPQIAERANAWATGDIAVLRNTPAEAQQDACLSAWFESDTARKRGLTDMDARIREEWLRHADQALRESSVTFATVGMSDLLKAGGYLEQLQARGYLVEAPE